MHAAALAAFNGNIRPLGAPPASRSSDSLMADLGLVALTGSGDAPQHTSGWQTSCFVFVIILANSDEVFRKGKLDVATCRMFGII